MADSLLRVEIVDEAGHPVPDAMLAVVRSSVPFPEVALISDVAGVVALKLPDGTFLLRAHCPDGRRGEVEVSSPAQGSVRLVVGS